MAARQSAFRLFAALSIALTATAGFAQWQIVTLNAASGTGTISTSYTTTGLLTLNNGFWVDYLVVGGGGGGGGSGDNGSAWGGGGGGAGGLVTGSSQLGTNSYTVVVGGGGAGGQFSATAANQLGKNGADSELNGLIGQGGGGGGSFKVAGSDGGSGGGGGGRGTGNDLRTPGGYGNYLKGKNGGASRDDDSNGRSAGGGGGGAGAVGGTGGTNVTTAGDGGAGLASSITGSSVTYAGGGGGGAWDTFSSETSGTGGAGGGGAGSTSGNGTAGTDNYGGGGGGVGTNGAGGRGGSGIVIVRYQGASLGAIGGTVTSGSGSAAGYTLHTFTTSGTTTLNTSFNLSGVDMNARLGATVTGKISGSGSLTFGGPGRLTLAASNSFTGDTRITSGTLAIANGQALLNSTLDMNASDSGAITFSQFSLLGGLKGSRDIANGGITLGVGMNSASTTYSGVLSGSGGLNKYGTGTLTLTGNNTYTRETNVFKGTLAIGDGGTTGSLVSGNMYLNEGTSLTFNRSDAMTYAGNITGEGSLTKLGAGALTLTGANTFTGDTAVSAGTLVLGSGNALSPTAAVAVASGATLQATTPIRIGYLDSQGAVVGGANLSATLTVTNAGSIGGITNGSDGQGAFAAGIVKLSTGTSTVNAANTYTGLTWVRAGTLATGVSNAFAAASDLTVDSGATLDRAGYSQTVADAVLNGTVGNTGGGGLLTVTGTLSGTGLVNGDVLVNGVHAPGNSPGIQTFDGNLSYGNGAVVNWELIDNTTSNSPVVYDQIVLSNAANLSFGGSNVLSLSFNGAGSLVDWNDSFWDVNRAWTVFDLASGVTTGFGNLSLGGSLLDANSLALDAGTRGSFSLAQSGQDVVLQFTTAAVPEPSTIAMALAGVACGGYLVRRRHRQA